MGGCALKKLEEWHEQGFEVNFILDHATLSGWRGLWLPAETPRIRRQQQPKEYTAEDIAHMAEIQERIRKAEEAGKQRWAEKFRRPA